MSTSAMTPPSVPKTSLSATQSPPPAETSAIRSTRFRAEREADWKRLEEIIARCERSGVRSLSFDDARDLAILYRQAMNSLSVAR